MNCNTEAYGAGPVFEQLVLDKSHSAVIASITINQLRRYNTRCFMMPRRI